MTPEAQVTALLTQRGEDGDFVHAERDVVACFAILLKANPARSVEAKRYVDRLALYAHVQPEDAPEVRAEKIAAYFEAYPVPPALVRALQAALGLDAPPEARDFGRLLGVTSAKTVRSGPRAGALHFMIQQKTKGNDR